MNVSAPLLNANLVVDVYDLDPSGHGPLITRQGHLIRSSGPVTLDLGVIYYGYVDQPSGSHEDYWEFKAAGSIPAGPATLGALAAAAIVAVRRRRAR